MKMISRMFSYICCEDLVLVYALVNALFYESTIEYM